MIIDDILQIIERHQADKEKRAAQFNAAGNTIAEAVCSGGVAALAQIKEEVRKLLDAAFRTRQEIEEAISHFVIDACAAQRQCENAEDDEAAWAAALDSVISAHVAGALMWSLVETEVYASEMRAMFDQRLAKITHDFDQAAAAVRDGGVQ